jgi:anti-anti-sigma factor
MEHPNEILLENHEAVTILAIGGDITAFSESFLNDAYNQANQKGNNRLLLQFEPGAYINSGGIAILIQLLALSQKNDQRVGITGLSDHFQKIFNMVGITKFANIFPTKEEALEALQK